MLAVDAGQRARPRGDQRRRRRPSALARSPRELKPVDELIRFVRRARRRGRARRQAQAARPRHLDHRRRRGAVDEAVKRNVFRPRLQARRARRRRSAGADRAAARARGARCAGDRRQGRQRGDRVSPRSRRRSRGRHRGADSRRATPPRTASASSMPRCAQRKRRRNRAKSAVIDVFSAAQLDLALGRPNVVHAALLAGPGERDVSRARRALAALSDGFGRDAASATCADGRRTRKQVRNE